MDVDCYLYHHLVSDNSWYLAFNSSTLEKNHMRELYDEMNENK